MSIREKLKVVTKWFLMIFLFVSSFSSASVRNYPIFQLPMFEVTEDEYEKIEKENPDSVVIIQGCVAVLIVVGLNLCCV